jgi:hypothetical protein
MEILEMALHKPLPSAKVMAGIVEQDSKTPIAGCNVEPNTEHEPDTKDETDLGKAAVTEDES